MKSSDPYRVIAGLFPIFDRFMARYMGNARHDLISILQAHHAFRVMDLGCGTGDFSRHLADLGYRTVCVDISPSMLKLAAEKAQALPTFETVLADGSMLPFHSEFDAVLMRFVFHEMDPRVRESVWGEMTRLLNDRGLVIFLDFTVSLETGFYPVAGRLLIRSIEKQMGWVHAPHYGNYREFMRKGGLVSWIRRHGGQIIEERRYLGGNLGLIAAEPSR